MRSEFYQYFRLGIKASEAHVNAHQAGIKTQADMQRYKKLVKPIRKAALGNKVAAAAGIIVYGLTNFNGPKHLNININPTDNSIV